MRNAQKKNEIPFFGWQIFLLKMFLVGMLVTLQEILWKWELLPKIPSDFDERMARLDHPLNTLQSDSSRSLSSPNLCVCLCSFVHVMCVRTTAYSIDNQFKFRNSLILNEQCTTITYSNMVLSWPQCLLGWHIPTTVNADRLIAIVGHSSNSVVVITLCLMSFEEVKC